MSRAGMSAPPRGARALFALAALLLLALLLHASALQLPFFADDYFFLEQAQRHSPWTAITAPDPLGNFFRPLSRQLYFVVMTRAFGGATVAFHAVNLLLFLIAIVLLFVIASDVAGAVAGVIAVAYFALHYAADVPVRWASGSQDLLALVFALGAIVALRRRMRFAAAFLMLAGLLCKEIVALAIVPAILVSRRDGEPWGATLRNAWPLVAAEAVWAAMWVITLRDRPGTSGVLSGGASGFLAALAHLLQVGIGVEWRAGGFPFAHVAWPTILIAVVAGAIVMLGVAAADSESADSASGAKRAIGIGAAWAICGALPIALVAPIWSAYFYLFALAGVALVVAGATMRLPRPATALVIGLLALTSADASHMDAFATGGGAWSWQSHVNRRYLERSMARVSRYLAEMRAQRPTLEPRTTVFFANLPVSAGWQAGDGPLLRWAYRDTTLRSYFFGDFTHQRAARGPIAFFVVENGALVDKSADPFLLPSLAYSMILTGRLDAACDALDLALGASERSDSAAPEGFGSPDLHMWRAWARWALGDSVNARDDLIAAGIAPARATTAIETEITAAAAAAAAVHDTLAAIDRLLALRARAGLEPRVHARLAALGLAVPERHQLGVIEAFAYRALAPDDPDAWRKWASAQLGEGKHEAALASLERYVALAGPRAAEDREVQEVLESLRRIVRGDVAQEALRRD